MVETRSERRYFQAFLLICIASGVAGLLPTAVASAEDTPAADTPAAANGTDSRNWLPLGLQSFEPSAFGYTKNNDDVGFYNIKLSVKFPLAPSYTKKWWGDQDRLFFAFTGVSGFYINTRHSDPVVAKEFNPQFFWQHSFSCDRENRFQPNPSVGESSAGSVPEKSDGSHEKLPCYFAIGYNHDSNGQNIDSLGQYEATQKAQGTEAANDAISRGWDYLGVTVKTVPTATNAYRVSVYAQLKYFLADGLLQKEQEELHYWENPSDGKPRREVDGLGFLAKVQFRLGSKDSIIGDGKLAIRYGTGYVDPFRFSTVRVEAGIQVLQLPIVFWGQKGYMSDLSQYYRNVTGYGVEIEIGAF